MGKITEAELEKLKAMSDSPVENAKKEALEASMQNAEVAASNEVFSDTIVKLKNLESQVEALTQSNVELSNKLDAAYAQMKDMATATV